MDEVPHERLEAPLLRAHLLEVGEGVQDDLVAALYQTDGRQQLQHQRLRSGEGESTSVFFVIYWQIQKINLTN